MWRIKSTQRRTTRSRTKELGNPLELTSEDYDEAERILIRQIQSKAFPAEKKNITDMAITSHESRGNMSIKTSQLSALNPFIGADQIIRVGSRIAYADIDEETKFPAILPREDPNVKDLIQLVHTKEAHAGPKHVLCQLRQKYWILQGLQATKMVVNRCVLCQKRFRKPEGQKMAPLPKERVNIGAPFSQVGLDMMGPFKVKITGRAMHKINVAIFTCLETRSVHAEIVYKMDASALVNALARFTARRPGLQRIISDRGSNFKGADNLLQRETEELSKKMEPELAARGWSWTWIPAGTPHYGGVWERVVGMFKRHLAALSTGETFHIETFWTIITEIEATINRRPLTSISTDSRDLEALTPAHILYPATFGHSSARTLPYAITTDAERMRYTWKRAQSRVAAFWKEWKRDYLTMLHNRPKWRKTMRDLAVDDIVILVDETTHRDEWKLGRIVNTNSSDGHVRKVSVRRADGKEVERDRTKVVRLELDDDDGDVRKANVSSLRTMVRS